MNNNEELNTWLDSMTTMHLPRWEDLPELDLYMDQVLTLVERYLYQIFSHTNEKILTKSMVNNYVKWQLIPPPNKKFYTKKHVAYLIAITLLKQVLTINEVKSGIQRMVAIYGEKKVYNYFIVAQELAIKNSALSIKNNENYTLNLSNSEEGMLTLKFAVLSLSSKIITEKIIGTL